MSDTGSLAIVFPGQGSQHIGMLQSLSQEHSIIEKTFDTPSLLKKYKLKHSEYCLFLPGSRPAHFEGFFPMVIASIKQIKINDPDFPAMVCLSPFLTEKNKYDSY